MIGRTLAHYRITSALGAGGMGEVYRATDTRLGRDVALKVLPPDMAGDADRLARFQREARAVAGLNHPNIVTLHSVEQADGLHFFTMELVEGRSLDRLIAEGPVPVDRLLAIATAVADALEAAHAMGLVHRDLKPANVMVTDAGRVKILDFGLAKDTRPAAPTGDTVTSASGTAMGVVMGTPAYMSPEQVEGRVLDQRTDLFSLGVLLYEMATARRPFAGDSPAALAAAILRDTPEPIGARRAGLPVELARLAEQCLAKNASHRPANAAEVRARLATMLSGGSAPDGLGLAGGVTGVAQGGNLPASVDSFVAREQELDEVAALVGDTGLVTLVGAGGTGKTRLAIEAARRVAGRFEGGTWLVELAPVAHADAVAQVVADLIGAVPRPGRTIVQSVIDALRHRALLLVLDNCEHVLDAAAELAAGITTQCGAVRVLATSRENLGIRGERVVRLQSLADRDGARLLRDRALAAGAGGDLDMETLARLSRRLDGMPLAIELAAARCNSMRPEEIERRLDDRFRLLRGSRRGRTERHQTLYNTVAWSYELLAPQEQRVFDRLSAFAGGFTLETARAVAGGDDIDGLDVEDAVAALVTRSMVLAADTGNGTRYRLLETLRQFGEQRLLASGDAERIHERHVRCFADLMTRAWSGLWSADDAHWIRRVGHEFENLRVAVYGAIDRQDREALAALLKPHLWWAWHALRYEVGDWAEAALAVSPEPDHVRCVAIHLRTHSGRPDEAIRLASGLGDPGDAGEADAVSMLALGRWNEAMLSGSPDMTRWMQMAIDAACRTGNVARSAVFQSLEVVFRVVAGEMDEARRIAVEAHEQSVRSGNQAALCWTSFFMGRAHSDVDPAAALEHFDRVVRVAQPLGLLLQAGVAATEAAVVIARAEDPRRGRTRLAAAVRSFIDSGDLRQLWTSAHHLAYFLIRVDRRDDARRLWRELGSRQAYAAQHHRDELTALIGPPGESALPDDELVEAIRNVLDSLDDTP